MKGFFDDSAGKEYACNARDAGDAGLIPGSRRSPGGGNGNPLQYSCLANPMERSLVGYYSPWGLRVGYDLASEHNNNNEHEKVFAIKIFLNL